MSGGVAIVDYGVGNLGSMANMLRRVGGSASVTGDPAEIASAERIILPGVGSFDHCRKRLDATGLVDVLERRVLSDGVPFLGVCVGLQLLMRGSEEGDMSGLGWLEGETVRFRIDEDITLPHMGWNLIERRIDHPLIENLDADARFYFVHEFHPLCDHDDDVIATSDYHGEFAAIAGRGNIMGTQFHPEKSHRFGMQLMKNFLAL